MARPCKIVQLGLELETLSARDAGRTLDATVERLNALLAARGNEASVSRSAVARYIARLDASTVGAAHAPQIARENAALSVDIGRRVSHALAALDQSLLIAQAERDRSGNDNWTAILGIMAEQRKHMALYANVLDAVCSARIVDAFQTEVLGAIERADPQTASRVRAALRRRYELRRAEVLGA